MMSFKQITLFIVLLFSSYFTANSQVNLSQGLVAYYPFNGTANDASGNNNNPTFNNATLTTDRNGNANSAYHFNGIDNYMQIPNSGSLNTGSMVSVCVMVKTLGFYYGLCHGNQMVGKGIDNVNSNSNYYLRYSDLVNNCSGGVPDSTKEFFYGNNVGSVPKFPIQKNKWYSVVFTYDGAKARLYINCQLVGETSVLFNFNNSADLFLGKMNSSGFPYWLNGDLDEVRIYNRALNSDEVLAYSGLTKPDFSFTQNICNPKQITLKNESTNYTKYYWHFGNGTVDSTTTQPTVNYSNYGNYDIKLITANNFGCVDTAAKTVLVSTANDASLIINSSDTTICSGTIFKLIVKDTTNSFCWSVSNGVAPNNASPTVSPTTNTTYYLNSQILGSNLIVNGDFEAGNNGFNSSYTYHPGTAGGIQGIYNIANNPNVWLNAFSNCKDHTLNNGSGKMMMIDGSTQTNVPIWNQLVNIQPNTNYIFSVWLTSIVAQNPAQLKFSINGIQVGQLLQATNINCQWNQFYVVWNSGINTTANISIVNENTIVQGNDFAL
ncbi:MAG: LamG-like jellyroll fold domain-containing protein, partial [Chitinophagaceae bacterium]